MCLLHSENRFINLIQVCLLSNYLYREECSLVDTELDQSGCEQQQHSDPSMSGPWCATSIYYMVQGQDSNHRRTR